MATIKCYSGGKLIKTFKNIEEDDIEFSQINMESYNNGASSGHGFTIKDEGMIRIDWRGDYLIEW